MIFPKLLALSSIELAAEELPPDPEECAVRITAAIGSDNGGGADNFDFLVATPSGLVKSGTYGWGRGILIVESFSWPTAERAVNRLLAHAARATWQEVALALNRDLHWEFDGF